MAVPSDNLSKVRNSVKQTLARASVKFELKDGSEAGSLVIENERLKTTILVLTEKLKVQEHSNHENDQMNLKLRVRDADILDYKSQIAALESKTKSQ